MRNMICSAIVLLLLISCGETKKKSNEDFLPDASGAINNVSVVTENDLWEGRVGDAIRTVLTKPIYGLPQDEPMFSISQIPSSVFSGFVTKNRTVLIINPKNAKGFNIATNVYAKPQKVITVSGKTKEEIIEVLSENESKIIEIFRGEELAERQRQMMKSPHTFKSIQEKLGLTMQFASIYRKATETEDFFWFRKDITTGTNNLMLYELPLNAIKRNDSLVSQIIKIRDSVGKTYIEGPVEGSYMVTEDAYAPYITETIIDNKPAIETRGIWDVKNAFMAGPFINYAIEDKANNRWVVIEGFSFAPSVEKRNYMLELESIIKSVKIDLSI
ncbi:DUF4837 family protein [Tamlana sp. 2_MG-2023]|uniref:DUF4837 family protein n=1 Tax=unclassified Tamlana TaxID=2614803 RepID=UPI0026E114A5|nr:MULTISPECIES: DUF4837 family protein [unclassified Tamlana]MDO6759731.1 DUF4837 family protein [Tamlana sp. 2_MG-2023]MDO6791354.1 DUF4837 family protein [Tamlana sp. 1_MG-2023]